MIGLLESRMGGLLLDLADELGTTSIPIDLVRERWPAVRPREVRSDHRNPAHAFRGLGRLGVVARSVNEPAKVVNVTNPERLRALLRVPGEESG